MSQVDYRKVFEVLDKVTGLPLRRRGRYWFGNYYLDGTPHRRWDKMCARVAPRGDTIQILESGGECVTLWTWLKKYGGCMNDHEVYLRLDGETTGVVAPKQPILPTFKHISEQLLIDAEKRSKNDYLWAFLTGLWEEDEVRAVYDKYRVTSTRVNDGSWAAQFWFIDRNGQICHDKIIKYQKNGHRDHSFGGGREYKTSDGYGFRCYFGEHLLKNRAEGQRVFMVESEKTAILMSLRFPKHIYLACGGCNNLKDVEKDWELLPDYDEAGMKWQEKYPDQCVEWWKSYKDVQKGEDMGDVIVKEKRIRIIYNTFG